MKVSINTKNDDILFSSTSTLLLSLFLNIIDLNIFVDVKKNTIIYRKVNITKDDDILLSSTWWLQNEYFRIPGSQIGARCGTPGESIPAEALRNPGSPDRVHCETPSGTQCT